MNMPKASLGGLAKRFGPLEHSIMTELWRDSPLDVRTVNARLLRAGDSQQPVAYSTVKTVMERLVHKGHLQRELFGRQFMYRPVHTKLEMESIVAQTLVEDLMGNFGTVAVKYFVDGVENKPEHLRALRVLL